MAFDPEVTEYTVASVGFALTTLSVQVTPVGQASEVVWQGFSQTLDSEGRVELPLSAGAAHTLTVQQSEGPLYTLSVRREAANELGQRALLKAGAVEMSALVRQLGRRAWRHHGHRRAQ